jgi:HK97 family phage prohead protease
MSTTRTAAPERRMVTEGLRVERSAGRARIVGYAIRFNRLSEDLGGWREIISPRALDGVLDNDVRALVNHNPDIVLGRTTNRTLRLELRRDGLWIEIDPPDTEQARGYIVAIERGDISGQSFTFTLPEAPEGRIWEADDAGNLTRTVTKIAKLWDLGPCTFPAYGDTDVSMRSSQALEEAARWLKATPPAATRPLPDFAMMRRRLDLEAML